MTTATGWPNQLISDIADEVLARVRQHLATDAQMWGDQLTYDEQQAAQILGVARHVLKACRERGEIQPRKIGKKWHYSREQLIAFAQGQE